MEVKKFIALHSGVSAGQIQSVLTLTAEGATIPFIARYRKERTGNLDEVRIEKVLRLKEEFEQISKRQDYILKVIDEQQKLTVELKQTILDTFDLNRLEDYYLPFKKRRTTKTEKARQAGLTGLAKLIMKQDNGDPVNMARRFFTKEYSTPELALEGALLIIADWINEDNMIRERLRESFFEHGSIVTKLVKGGDDIDGLKKYKDFYDFRQRIKHCPAYRLLAVFRGEKEKVIRVKIEPNPDYAIGWMNKVFVKRDNLCGDLVKKAVIDAYKRLLQPQLETEVRKLYKTEADQKSIETFSKNLSKILLAPPIGTRRILAIDPGFKTGCKVVCLDEAGSLLHNTTVYPHPPKKEKSKASAKIAQLVESYKIEAIAIGDGTAGRESEQWIKHIRFNREVKVYVVREDGASIYSASKIARAEFPEYDITVRGAISIGRRLSDPLAELVKIDPKSLGVGQYQHDVNQTKLQQALDFTVQSAVNQVGVNLNTASSPLLARVSGIGEKTAESIVKYRVENGLFKNRNDLKKVPGLGAKVFEQAAGFLRIRKGNNVLDNTGVHPEQYKTVSQIAKHYNLAINDLIENEEVLKQVKADSALETQVGEYTLADVVEELKKPGLDPRQAVKLFEFTPGIKTINDLKIGMKVNGIITNVTDFGAFVNIGIKQNGLIHKTQLADDFVEVPTDVIGIDDHVNAKIIQLDIERNRIGLSLKN